MYEEDDFLQLSGIQHFAFCKRQWALIHIEGIWEDNIHTISGRMIHSNVDEGRKTEKRKSVITYRSVPLSSRILGLSGIADVIEVICNENKKEYVPVEYKHGIPKKSCCDTVQVCAQAIALEEMTGNQICLGSIYYHGIRRRINFPIDDGLRRLTKSYADEMHRMFNDKVLPKATMEQHCLSCSLFIVCMPNIKR